MNSVPGSNDGLASDFKESLRCIPSNIEQASNYFHEKLFPRKFCKATWKVAEEDFNVAMKNVEELIEKDWSTALAMPLDDMHARYVIYMMTKRC